MAFLKWLLTFCASGVVLFFTLYNLDSINFNFSPFHESLNIPVFFVILASVSFGFLWGGALVWFNGHAKRKELRITKKALKHLEDEKNEKEMQEEHDLIEQIENQDAGK